MTTKEATLKIPALHCGRCAISVTRKLRALPSVEVTHTDPLTKVVDVEFDESAISLVQIQESLEELGYFAED